MRHIVLLGLLFICISISYSELQARVIEDMIGRSVQVPEDIERIASPYRVATDMVFALAQQKKLIAVSNKSPSRAFKRLCPEHESLQLANRESSVETFLRLSPDVVFMRPGSLVSKLEKMGVPVFCLQVETPQTMIDGLIMVSRVLGVPKKAKRVADYFQKKLEYIQRHTQNIRPQKKVYFVGSESLFATCGGDFYQDAIINRAGGINVAHNLRGGWVTVSREHILKWRPDVFVFTPYSHVEKKALFSDPALAKLKAVKNEQVYTFPKYLDTWDLPTPESILGIMWLARKLYPGQIKWDIREEAKYFYTHFYGGYPIKLQLVD